MTRERKGIVRKKPAIGFREEQRIAGAESDQGVQTGRCPVTGLSKGLSNQTKVA